MIKAENCPICQFQAMSNPDMVKYLKKKTKVKEETVFEEVKKINKRRKVLHNDEYVQYVCKQFNLTEDILLKEIKETYGTYKKFLKYIGR